MIFSLRMIVRHLSPPLLDRKMLTLNLAVSLPADWTLWAASKESAFLGSGRLIWAHWDIDELKEVFGRMEAGKEQDGVTIMGVLPVNQRFTVGLIGWPDAVPIANTTAA